MSSAAPSSKRPGSARESEEAAKCPRGMPQFERLFERVGLAVIAGHLAKAISDFTAEDKGNLKGQARSSLGPGAPHHGFYMSV